ncbi:MAG: VTT domain-containing protein [Candidatus Poseidoniaceae archaeon]|nr:VTT domain-containing protein [Candidatus Poseidoniaceae archaeon]
MRRIQSSNRIIAMLGILGVFAIYTLVSIPVVTSLAKWTQPMAEWQALNGLAGPLAFAVLFAILATLMVPSSFMKLVAGALFGFGGGLLAGWLGAMGGAIIAFLIARYFMADRVQSWSRKYPKIVALDRVAEHHGLTMTILIRFSLVIPYNMINWMLGPTKMKTRDYAIGNIATIVPTILYAWWGSQLANLIAVGDATSAPRDNLWWVAMVCSIIITVGGIIWMDQISRRFLEQLIEESE